jgi:predicted DNA-binding transcriptional regulator AlpA
MALSIPEFCQAHGISEGFFYKLKKQGEGPREMKVGARTLITFESAAEWRRAREKSSPCYWATKGVPQNNRMKVTETAEEHRQERRRGK